MPSSLVIEDCSAYRKAVCEVLRDSFPALTVCEAGTGLEALRQARSTSPDLVFLDLHLRDVDSLSLARRLSRKNTRPCLVGVSTFDIPEYREAAHRAGIREFLVKTVSTPRDLVALAFRVLSERGQTPAAAASR